MASSNVNIEISNYNGAVSSKTASAKWRGINGGGNILMAVAKEIMK
jgi:hypothetical protein